MKKRGFVTIYVLLLLLILSITISFLFNQNKNDLNFNKDLYDKKQALYISESVANLALKDEGLNEYKEKIFQSIKDYYRKAKNEGTKIEEEKVGETKAYYPKINYIGRVYTPKTSYITTKKKIRLESEANLGDTRAKTIVEYKVDPIFEFFKEEPIKYDFKEEIKFKNLNLKEDPDIIDLEKENEEKFYKINDDLVIKKVNENVEEQEDIEQEETSTIDTNFELKSEEDSGNNEKSDNHDQKNIEESIVNSTDKEKMETFKGILYIKGDLILKTDLSIEGLLILDGKIINKSLDKDKNPKLTLRGQMISSKEFEKDNLDYIYDKDSYKYIDDIENLFDTKLISKRVY